LPRAIAGDSGRIDEKAEEKVVAREKIGKAEGLAAKGTPVRLRSLGRVQAMISSDDEDNYVPSN
jgi:hypothetical protein